MSKTIIFGDIHGCYKEWEDLLNKIGPSSKDQLITVGDIVCKGPSTKKALDLAMSLKNLKCVQGNHEYYLLRHWKEGTLDDMKKSYQYEAVEEMGKKIDKYMKFIDTWPFYLDLKEVLVVHGGIRPDLPLKKQDPFDLVTLRTIEDGETPWHETYKSKKLACYGHWAKQGLCVKKNSIGLDTGCVYGKELTAVILPERKIVSVKARKEYIPIK